MIRVRCILTGCSTNRSNRSACPVAICYEDRTVLELEKKDLLAEGRAAHAAAEIQWLAEHWFPLDHYTKHNGRPLLLSFGVANMTDEEWSETLQLADVSVAYVSQAKRRPGASGVFDWPVPSQGLAAQERFLRGVVREPLAIPVAFPRFDDIYEQAGLHASAILKDPSTYEHISPDLVGNERIIPMSNQAGQSNLRARLASAIIGRDQPPGFGGRVPASSRPV